MMNLKGDNIMKEKLKLRTWVKVVIVYIIIESLLIGFLLVANKRVEDLDHVPEVMLNE